jgi:hypothetical protein
MIDPVGLMLSNQFDFWQRKYYVGHNTFGTAIAINATPTAISSTAAMFSIYNTSTETGSTNRSVIVAPLYLKLFCKTAGAASTDFSIKVSTDVVERKTDTTGTQLTMYSTFVDSDTANAARPTAVSEVWFGDLTIAVKSSEVQIGDVQVKPPGSTAGFVVGDEILIAFGAYAQTANVSSTAPATTFTNNAKNFHKVIPPVFLGPGSSLIMQPFATATTG